MTSEETTVQKYIDTIRSLSFSCENANNETELDQFRDEVIARLSYSRSRELTEAMTSLGDKHPLCIEFYSARDHKVQQMHDLIKKQRIVLTFSQYIKDISAFPTNFFADIHDILAVDRAHASGVDRLTEFFNSPEIIALRERLGADHVTIQHAEEAYERKKIELTEKAAIRREEIILFSVDQFIAEITKFNFSFKDEFTYPEILAYFDRKEDELKGLVQSIDDIYRNRGIPDLALHPDVKSAYQKKYQALRYQFIAAKEPYLEAYKFIETFHDHLQAVTIDFSSELTIAAIQETSSKIIDAQRNNPVLASAMRILKAKNDGHYYETKIQVIQTVLDAFEATVREKASVAILKLSQKNQELAHQILAKSGFDTFFLELMIKKERMATDEDPVIYAKAVTAADHLINLLDSAQQNFISSDETIENRLIEFKKACKKAMDPEAPHIDELGKQRGWKQLIANGLSIVLSIATFGIYPLFTLFAPSLKMYSTKTATMKIVDHIDEAANKACTV